MASLYVAALTVKRELPNNRGYFLISHVLYNYYFQFFVTRKFEQLTSLMHEDSNWAMYREEVDRKLRNNSHFIPFLGVFLTTTAFTQSMKTHSANLNSSGFSILHRSTVKEGSNQRRMARIAAMSRMCEDMSMDGTYEILEPITVRQRLEKLKQNSIGM